MQKKYVTYFMIAISLLITLASIAVKTVGLDQGYSNIVVLVSGVILVVNIFCSFWEFQLNIEAVNMLERYDVYVFNLPVNKAILRPIPEQSIVNYARKFKNVKKIKALRNFYFKNETEASEKNVLFNKLKNDFAYDHRLLINVHGFFMFLWVGYIALIMTVAVFLGFAYDGSFIDTLVNIFVPALSTISLIASAWKSYYEQFRRLTNAVNVTNELEQNAKKDSSSLQSQLVLRQLQDAMHIHRQKSFTIPEFLIRRFNKRLVKEEELLKQEMFLHESFKRTDKPQTTKRTIKPATKKEPAAKEPAATKPTTKEPAAKEPAATKPTAKEPAATKPTAKEPAATKPTAKEPAVTKPTAKQTTTKTTTTKETPAKPTSTKTPSTKTPAKSTETKSKTTTKKS